MRNTNRTRKSVNSTDLSQNFISQLVVLFHIAKNQNKKLTNQMCVFRKTIDCFGQSESEFKNNSDKNNNRKIKC